MLRLNKQFFVNVFSSPEPEEPDQRPLCADELSIIRHEKVRLFVLATSLLVFLFSFLCFLFAHTVIPLCVAILLAFCGYRSLDAYMRTLEH